MTEVTSEGLDDGFRSSSAPCVRNERTGVWRVTVTRTLLNHNVWLALTCIGLILLMARTYA